MTTRSPQPHPTPVWARVVDKPCTKLLPWELARVPSDRRAPPIGYRLCCPSCGFVTLSVIGDQGQALLGRGRGLSLAQPVECLYCEAQVLVQGGQMTLVEDGHVHRRRLS